METIILLLTLILLSIITALVGFGFQRMMDADMIFEWYKNWLNYLAHHKFPTFSKRIFNLKLKWNTKIGGYIINKWFHIPHFNLRKTKWYNTPSDSGYKNSKLLYYITKPLGRCIICNTTWIGFILTLSFLWGDQHLIRNMIVAGVSSAALVILIVNYFNNLQREY